MKFYDYQTHFADNNSRLKIYNKSRQIGISFFIAYLAVKNAYLNGSNVLFASASLRQSTELNRICFQWIDCFKKLDPSISLSEESKSVIGFNNGGRIHTLPSNPKTVRGFHGDVYLDEFALHKDQAEIYKALFPSITRGYNITIISTPLGQSDLFHDIWSNMNKYPDFSRHQTTIYQAKKQGFDADIDIIKRNTDEETFRQEYLCEFIDETSSYFPYTLIRDCTGDRIPDGETFMGVDIGRHHDLTVIYVVSKAGDKYFTRQMEILKAEEYQTQMEVITQIILETGITRGSIDASGIGNQLAEDLHRRFHFMEPVPFTNKIKEELVTTARKLFEQKNVQIPNDRDIISDIHSIKKSVTSAGNIRFDSVRTDKGHSDRFWALALALYSGKEEGLVIDDISVL